MARKANAQVVREFLDLVAARDGDRLAGLLAEEAVHDAPDGERVVGRNAVRDAIMASALGAGEERADIAIMTDDESDRAAAEFTLRGNGGGTGVTTFDLEDGRIARVSEFRRST